MAALIPADILASLSSTQLRGLGGLFTNTSSMTTSVQALLTQAELNPSMAAQLAAQISAIPNVPPSVLAYVSELPQVSNDHSAYVTAITQAQAALQASTSHGFFGNLFNKLGA
jgi:uncharacterized membrane protein